MTVIWIIIIIVVSIISLIARASSDYSKDRNNGQSEYEAAEQAISKMDVSRFKLNKRKEGFGGGEEDESMPIVDVPQMAYDPPPENQPFIRRSRSNLSAVTVLDLLIPPERGSQICSQGDRLYLMDALRNECFDFHELPGSLIDFKTVWIGRDEGKANTELTAFIICICQIQNGAKMLEVLVVPDPMLYARKRFVETIYSDVTTANTIAHVSLDEEGMPVKVILLDNESSILEYRHLRENAKMTVEFDNMILVDLSASPDPSFFMYDGENMERWMFSTFGINRIEAWSINGDVEKSNFSFTRSTFPGIEKPVLMTADKVVFADTGKTFDINNAMFCTSGKLVATSEALYHLGSDITKIIDRPLKPLVHANLYEDPDSFWAVYLDTELMDTVYVLDAEKESVMTVKFGPFSGKVVDATMTMTTEELFIYTTQETVRIGNLGLFEATEIKVSPMEPEKPDIFGHGSDFGGL